MNARAQSEVLGFVLVFSLITMSAGIVFVSGFAGLQDAQQAEQLDNMGRAFDVLDANLADVHERGAPSRATEIHLSGGSLGFGEPIQIQVRATDTDGSNPATFVMSARPLVYSGEDETSFVYVAGAVIRTQGDRSVMQSTPDFRVSDTRTVIPFIVTYPDSDESLAGDSTVLIVGTNLGNELDGSYTPTGTAMANVDITVESPRADAWGRYFENEGYTAVDADASDDSITYQLTTERLYVYRSVIEFDLER